MYLKIVYFFHEIENIRPLGRFIVQILDARGVVPVANVVQQYFLQPACAVKQVINK